MNKIITLFSSKGFDPNELFGEHVESDAKSAVQILSGYFLLSSFEDYVKGIFNDTEKEAEFCSSLISNNNSEREIKRHFVSLKNNNSAKNRKLFYDRFVEGNEAILQKISRNGGYHLYMLNGIPNVYGVKCLKQADTSDLWIPTLIRCVWSLSKDVSRIQLVLHDKDVPAWKGIRTDDVTILTPAENSHFMPEEAFDVDDDSKALFQKILSGEVEVRIVFFHHTQNEIAKIVGHLPSVNEDINSRIQSFIDKKFEDMKKDVLASDGLLTLRGSVDNT